MTITSVILFFALNIPSPLKDQPKFFGPGNCLTTKSLAANLETSNHKEMYTNSTSIKSLFPRRLLSILKFNFIIVLVCLISFQAGAHNNTKNALPVFATDLAFFTSGQNLVISWQADKDAFNYYEVEKSTDGAHFSTVGLVMDAPENSNTCLFKDKKLPTATGKTVWYRIKAIAKDGIVSYSSNASYVSEIPAVSCESAAFPNPFLDATTVKFKSNETGFAEITVRNLEGQTLLSKQSHINVGYNSIDLEGLSVLSKGIYVARIIINGTVAGNQKLIKK